VKLWTDSKDKALQRVGGDRASGRVFNMEGRLHFEADTVIGNDGGIPRMPLCILKMLREDVGKGNRNQAMLMISNLFRTQGLDADATFNILKGWRKLQKGTHHTEDDVASQVAYIYRDKFNWGCNHPLAMANCFKACHKYEAAETTRNVNLQRLSDLLPDLVARERVPIEYYFPYPPFNKDVRLRPGMVVTLVAETGSGKTAFALDVCRYNSYSLDEAAKRGVEVYGGMGFASLEMPKSELVERGAQWVLGTDQKGVSSLVLEQIEAEDNNRPDTQSFRALKDSLKRYYNRVWVTDEDYVDLMKLESMIQAGKEKHGIGMWVVDYMGRLHGKGNTSYDKLSSIARELKTIARRNQVIIMILVQVARDASEKGLGLRSGRGSGEIEESADVLITLEIEDRDKPESERSGNVVLTNRKFRAGKKGSICKLRFVGESMRFHLVDENSTADSKAANDTF
jgi:KaiC/GvpD/RAD55 family RecA-like ATPase